MLQYRIKTDLPALMREAGRKYRYLSLPVGKVVATLQERLGTPRGMIAIICERCEYSVLAADISRKCERIA